MSKEPKRYICLDCGFKSKRYKTKNFPGIGFVVCHKCRGMVRETDEWLSWYFEQRSPKNRT